MTNISDYTRQDTFRAEILTAVDLCVARNQTFAVAALPGCAEPVFIIPNVEEGQLTDMHTSSSSIPAFGISKYLTPDKSLWITAEPMYEETCSVSAKDGVPSCETVPIAESTTYDSYTHHASRVVDDLRHKGGKTVLSTLIAVSSHKPFCEVVGEYFSRFPQTFRYVYFTPQTGLWFGASPELILDYEASSRTLRTMSLAGTRAWRAVQGDWDEKNKSEHQFVTEFILSTLRAEGLDPQITDSSDLRFGQIVHLCDRIEAHGEVQPEVLLAALSPTPALCGYPRAQAAHHICEHEDHQRLCYGGWIALKDTLGFHAYVNLRCACAAKRPDGSWLYNVYVGGGLTADSDVQDEWLETRAKAKTLLECITQ